MKRGEAYLHTVRQGLRDAPPEDRERLMKRLTEAVSAYLEENPEAGEADIVQAFGRPEDCAAELLEECDPAGVAAVRRKRQWRLYAVIAALVVLAALLALAAIRGMRSRSPTPDLPAENSFYHEEHSHGGWHHG